MCGVTVSHLEKFHGKTEAAIFHFNNQFLCIPQKARNNDFSQPHNQCAIVVL